MNKTSAKTSAKKDEALKMAIYALNRIRFPVGDGRNEALQACKEALEQPAQEPVAIVYSMQDGYIGQMVVKDIPHKTKLYTHPAPSWQGLTAKEIASIPLNEYTVQTVERMLKEKNT